MRSKYQNLTGMKEEGRDGVGPFIELPALPTSRGMPCMVPGRLRSPQTLRAAAARAAGPWRSPGSRLCRLSVLQGGSEVARSQSG